jgi:AcrR family transcriptional regulator
MSTRATPMNATRERLLDAGRELVLRQGMPNLTVREVAAAAGANLGSFVYHFGTRDAFLRALIEEWYAPLFRGVAILAASDGTGVERLRRAILWLVDFGIEHHAFFGRLIAAAAAREPAACDFLGSLAARHPRLLLRFIAAAQSEGRISDAPPLQVLCFLMAAVGLPLLLAGAWQGPPLFGRNFSKALGRVARGREYILQRLDWALRGLAPLKESRWQPLPRSAGS